MATRWKGPVTTTPPPSPPASSAPSQSVPEFQGYEALDAYTGWPKNADGSRMKAADVLAQGLVVTRSDGTTWTREELEKVALREEAPAAPIRAPRTPAEEKDPYLNPSLLGKKPEQPAVPTLEDLETAVAELPTGPVPEEMGPAEVDRTRIDELLGNVSRATSGLLGLATLDDQYSAAQAQLAQGLDQSRRQAIALARSGNRRDAAAMQARALQTGAELAAQATQSSALLRAQEEDAQQRLKLDAFKAAGDLGLNASALEVDVNNLNMQAATSYLNQLFETNRLGLQLDEAKAQRVTNFIRDMALIAKDYYALDTAERQAIRDDLTRRYGIDEQTRVALAQIEAGENFDWNALAIGIVSGAGSGATAAIAAKSDRHAKTAIDDHAEDELAELLESIGTKTYRYKKPEKDGKGRFAGPMYQDLEKTEIGRSMLAPQRNGDKMVDGGRAGLAALAGLAMVHDRLKALEAGL